MKGRGGAVRVIVEGIGLKIVAFASRVRFSAPDETEI
jgi:hypothetical protein